jgi:hypothetical protein
LCGKALKTDKEILENILLPHNKEWKIPSIFYVGYHKKWNSEEFLFPGPPGRGIPWNFCTRDLRDGKFFRIPQKQNIFFKIAILF